MSKVHLFSFTHPMILPILSLLFWTIRIKEPSLPIICHFLSILDRLSDQSCPTFAGDTYHIQFDQLSPQVLFLSLSDL